MRLTGENRLGQAALVCLILSLLSALGSCHAQGIQDSGRPSVNPRSTIDHGALAKKYGGVAETSPFEKLCTVLDGHPDVEFQCGLAYESGKAGPQDYARAAWWYRKAASQGLAVAQDHLASLYFYGEGVPQDYVQAAVWCRRAAEQGDAWAEGNLGMLYETGRGVPQDYPQAALWYRKAAEQGNSDARTALDAIEDKQSESEANERKKYARIAVASIGLVLLVGAVVALVRFGKTLLRYIQKTLPRTSGAKQLTVLLAVGAWCTACCLFQALNPTVMRHPINAAVTALLFSVPALIFGAVCLWWLSRPPDSR